MANKVVQLVDKNSNNLYPIAGSVITDAVSTTAISNQAVTNPKIENGAVNGVANDATAIGTAKLALDTVGTPNLRDESVTSDKIDWTTLDTGWVNCTYASGYSQPNRAWTNPFQCRRIGRTVYLRGEFVPNSTLTQLEIYVGTVPENFRPSYNVQALCTGMEGERYRVEIMPSGDIVCRNKIWAYPSDTSATIKNYYTWGADRWYSIDMMPYPLD